MDLQDIIDLLSNEDFGTEGVDLFRSFMPAEIDEGLLVTAQMPASIDKYNKHRKGSIQVIARGRDYDEVRDLMISVSTFLTIEGHEGDSAYYHYICPRHEPLIYPKSDANYLEASVNFDVAYNA